MRGEVFIGAGSTWRRGKIGERIPRIAGFGGGGDAVWRGEEEEAAGEGDRAVGPSGQWHKGERERSGRPKERGFGRRRWLGRGSSGWLAGPAGSWAAWPG